MIQKTIFDKIKKQNGEAFAKAIRSYDNGIFDVPNIVNIVRYAGREAEPIMNYLVSLKNVQIKEQNTHLSPFELLDKAGYNAYWADTLEKQNAIQKYFDDDEELCTFYDPSRFQKYFIVNAVRKDVDQIKRADFPNPQREDRYGTSVLSIQILKTGGFISIKNRYNHTVDCPDNTLSSNPDNIIQGLAGALKNYFKVDFSSQKTMLSNGYVLVDEQIIRYHMEINNIYMSTDCYVENGKIVPLDKDKEIMMEKFVFNTKTHKLRNLLRIDDGFARAFTKEIENKKVQITKNKDGSHQIFAAKEPIVTIMDGHITKLNLPTVTKLGDNFLFKNTKLIELNAPKVEHISDYFLNDSKLLQQLNLPNLQTVGLRFLFSNTILSKFEAPMLRSVQADFLYENQGLKHLELPSLQIVGRDFLRSNIGLTSFKAPRLMMTEACFLENNQSLSRLELPALFKAGYCFLRNNRILNSFYAPSLQEIGHDFMFFNACLKELELPMLMETGENFLRCNTSLKKLYTPNLLEKKSGFLLSNSRGFSGQPFADVYDPSELMKSYREILKEGVKWRSGEKYKVLKQLRAAQMRERD